MSYTYTTLKTAIKDYTENQETTFVSHLSDFISSAEERIFKSVDLDFFRKNVNGTTTASNEFLAVPDDYLASFSLAIENSGAREFIIQKDVNFVQEYNSTIATTGVPKYYANWDANFWVIAPTPNASFEITLAYIKQPTSLTDSSVSGSGTYLSNKYQDLLLYACLVNTYAYLKGPQDMLQYYQGEYSQALETYALEQIGNRRRDEYEDGQVRAQLNVKPPSSYGNK